MAWTYSGNPAANSKDAVRFLVGDTQEDEQLVQDAEISWALAESNNNVYAAAAAIADSIAAFFATQPDTVKIGPITEQASYRAKNYADLAIRLSAKANRKQTIIPIGGSETAATFSKGMHDHNGEIA